VTDSEKTLIDRARSGDADCFEALINSSRLKAYNIALRYMRNEDDAMDALQESYIKIFKSLTKFKEESSFDTWVYRIVVNTCNDLLRKNRSRYRDISVDRKREDDSDCMADLPDHSSSPEMILERKEKLAEIMQCLDSLPHEQREAVMLRDVHGFSYEEISRILQCSDGTIKSRISRGRLALRKLLRE